MEVIGAPFAAAKGRIGRLFQTLQDRLVKELRLAGAATLAEANQLSNALYRFTISVSRSRRLSPRTCIVGCRHHRSRYGACLKPNALNAEFHRPA